MTPPLDIEAVRASFPALARMENGRRAAFLDGPGGTQVPGSVIEAMSAALSNGISNLGGGFGASDDAERIVSESRSAMSLLFNAHPDEIVFGQNMTSLTFSISRALARTWDSGDSIVLTSLDHDANFTPWEMAADDAGVHVRIAEFDVDSGRLDSGAVGELIDQSTRLVAVCLASNSLGTIVDVAEIVAAAHDEGALVYVDAVHAAPHHLIDVSSLGCDFLVASAYKFFGPHIGVLFGREEHLSSLSAYKVRPAPARPPGKWETGTQSFESLAGVTAAIGYMASLGEGDGRAAIESAFARIREHETSLGQRFLDGISSMSHVRLYGPPQMDGQRVATFAISVEGATAAQAAASMAEAGIYVWSGHYYAVNVMDRLGVVDDGGLVRIGFCHYNTAVEVDRVIGALDDLQT